MIREEPPKLFSRSAIMPKLKTQEVGSRGSRPGAALCMPPTPF